MLDHLSAGRLEFGFGKGISIPEHKLWGLDAEQADARSEESLDLVLAAFQSDGLLSFEGRFWSYTDVPIEQRPLQKPYPPLWRPGKVETAARMGVSTMAGGPISAVAATVARYHELHEQGVGRYHPPSIGGIRKLYVAPTDGEAETRGRTAWAAYTEHLTRLFRRFEIPPPNDPTLGGDYDRAKEVQAVVVGSPGKIREHLEDFAENAGTDYFVGCFAWGDLNRDEAHRSFDLFAEHSMAGLT